MNSGVGMKVGATENVGAMVGPVDTSGVRDSSGKLDMYITWKAQSSASPVSKSTQWIEKWRPSPSRLSMGAVSVRRIPPPNNMVRYGKRRESLQDPLAFPQQ